MQGAARRSATLGSAYRRSLEVAEELGARIVAFPAVSAGSYGWPLESAANIAVTTVLAHKAQAVQEVRFVLFGQQTYDAFARVLDA